MYEKRFSRWLAWPDRNKPEQCSQPGIYVIAIPAVAIAGQQFSWRRDIVYIGMTNSVGGLRSRLRQFDATMSGTLRHGGADRVRARYGNYAQFARKASVAIAPFRCAPGSLDPADLRTMGDVARFEFRCLAEYAAKFGSIPVFNDRSSPKHSHAG